MLIYRKTPIRNTMERYIRKERLYFSYIRKTLYIWAVYLIPVYIQKYYGLGGKLKKKEMVSIYI